MKSKLAIFLSKIPDDKKNHFIMGAVIMFILRLSLGATNLLLGNPYSRQHIIWTSFLLTCIIAFVVEVFDLFSKTGTADSIDGLATILGAIPQLQLEIQSSP